MTGEKVIFPLKAVKIGCFLTGWRGKLKKIQKTLVKIKIFVRIARVE